MGIDLLSVSGHKLYGPKGVGALYVRRRPRVRLAPLFSGGGQERGLRSGSCRRRCWSAWARHAASRAAEMGDDKARIAGLRDRFLAGCARGCPASRSTAARTHGMAGNLNLTFPAAAPTAMMRACPDLCVSTGSACSSAEIEPSYVLRALGLDEARPSAACASGSDALPPPPTSIRGGGARRGHAWRPTTGRQIRTDADGHADPCRK